MVLAISIDDAKKNQVKRDAPSKGGHGGGVFNTRFFGSRDNPNLPLAQLNRMDPGRYSSPHFHTVDQFQVFIDGKGKLGRHDLTPYCVHFTHAHTPYGPLVSDADTHLTFFVMRAHPDTGSQHLPEEREQLKQVANRQPWQVTRKISFPPLQSGMVTADAMLQPIPDVKDDQGLAAYTLSMKPNTKIYAPDPAQGEGQYLVVIKGSLFHDNKEHKAWALVFVWPKEGPFPVQAGAEGLEALVLNFPRAQIRTKDAAASADSTPL